MNWLNIITMLTAFVGTLSGAGPWGIGAMVLGGLGVLTGVGFLISGWNKNVDAGDLERSGADAGKTAVDLKNQADADRDFERREREDFEKKGPGPNS